MSIEPILLKEKPDLVLVYGDTNSTLAGALCASKLHIPVCHIEAGLRSYDKHMPEEQNRVIVDTLSSLLACPSQQAVKNLKKEGITKGVHVTGDIMVDAIQLFRQVAKKQNTIQTLEKKIPLLSTRPPYSVLTLHRASNTDNPHVLTDIIYTLGQSSHTMIFPIHPRTRQSLTRHNITPNPNIIMTDPVGYLEMITLLEHSERVITDSGGLQKEALFMEKPCITVRDTTEWVETVQTGWNTLVMDSPTKLNQDKLNLALNKTPLTHALPNPYGSGDAAEKIVALIS